jgi:hypothetical protein
MMVHKVMLSIFSTMVTVLPREKGEALRLALVFPRIEIVYFGGFCLVIIALSR